jgi:hypothetical protein
VSTDEWLGRLKRNKTMTASRLTPIPEELDLNTNVEFKFEDVVLLDEEVKKEYEQEQPGPQNLKDERGPKLKGFWAKADPGYRFYHRWQIMFPEENL